MKKGKKGQKKRKGKKKEVMNTIKNAEVVGHATIETYIRRGLEAQKEKNDKETYTIRDYAILDVNWGTIYRKETRGNLQRERKSRETA